MPGFSLLDSPHLLTVMLLPVKNAPLPLYGKTAQSASSVLDLAPIHFRHKFSSTSELLRYL